MTRQKVNYKSDFKVILQSEAGWGVPFKLLFYTSGPKTAYVASFDGHEYKHCHIQEDGRLCIAFDNHHLTCGQLMVEIRFYLNDECYESGICDEIIPGKPVTVTDEDGTEYELWLSMDGCSTLTTIGTLPAFYQKGDPGKSFTWDDLTPEQKAELKGEPGYTPQKGVDYFDGKNGDPGAPGAPGKDGRDGGLIYPSYKVDPHNMHLYSDTDTNRVSLSKDKHFTVKF